MSDKLEWLNQHMLLLTYENVADVIANEQYKPNTSLKKLIAEYPKSIDYLDALKKGRQYQDGVNFLGFNLHKRVAVWWAYICTLDLLSEQKRKPAEIQDIADIAAPAPFNVPDWAQDPNIEKEENDPEFEEALRALQSELDHVHELMDAVPQDVKDAVDSVFKIFDDEFMKEFGKTPRMLIEELKEKAMTEDLGSLFKVDLENSPIYKAQAELKEQIEKTRQETVEKIKAALGPVDIEAELENKANALDFVYKYIVSPDEDNAALCLDVGNKIPDKPEGLLALCAFWSFGNLTPQGEQVVRTPSSLLGNGLNSLFLMLALQQGGDCDFKQRYQKYFDYANMVATGKSNWSESVETKKIPHHDMDGFLKTLADDLSADNPVFEEKAEEQPHSEPERPHVERFK